MINSTRNNKFSSFILQDLQQQSTRRALTPAQQTNILTDVQQHQHRFSFPQNQLVNQNKFSGPKSQSFLLEPSIQHQLPTQTTIIQNQRHNTPPHQQFAQQNFQQPAAPPFGLNQQQSQNSFRTVSPPNNNDLHIQHHTQTNFIPNFAQRQFAPPRQQQNQPPPPPPPRSSIQFSPPPQQQHQHQNFVGPHPNLQPNPQLHQQPLHQRSIQNDFVLQQKPFHPSQPLPPLEPLLSTPNSLQPTIFSNPQQSIQQATTLQNQLFNTPAQFNFNQQPLTNQILQIQPSQAIPNQFLQNQPQPQFNSFIPQVQQPQQLQQQQQFIQPSAAQQQFYRDQREEEERLREKQAIIQKHEQFVQKQQQKQQSKVRHQHDEFLGKQRKIKEQSIAANRPTAPNTQSFSQQYTKSRQVYPFESSAFQRAIKSYYEANPTAPPTTTTTEPTTPARTTAGRPPPKAKRLRSKGVADISDDDLEQFLKTHRQKLYGELKEETEKQPKPTKSKVKSTKALGRDDLLKQLKLALAEAPQDLGNNTFSTMDLVLPGGQKVQVIRTSDPALIHGAGAQALTADNPLLSEIRADKLIGSASTEKPSAVSYDELANSGFIPPGADFEVIKQSADGDLQSVEKIPSQKKVTFVYLEEQNDGSYKVQGVKANGDKEAKTKGTEVENIIKRIKNGEISLPPPSKKVGTTKSAVTTTTTIGVSSTVSPLPSSSLSVIPLSSTQFVSSTPHYASSQYSSPSGSPSPSPILRFSSSVSPYSTLATIGSENIVHLTAAPSTHFPSSSLSTHRSTYESSPSTTVSPSTAGFQESTIPRSSVSAHHSSPYASTASHASSVSRIHSSSIGSTANHVSSSARHSSSTPAFVKTSSAQYSSTTSLPFAETTVAQEELSQILKSHGLHAMAKYLKQSGLDSILNETGPYTIFAPTDKAFKNLLVQLGGPERAEEKFKSNPRLLSGLLLHHVIPGSFEIASLQDEMTGVSLAGTQLRVNQYKMHDSEWNDVKVSA